MSTGHRIDQMTIAVTWHAECNYVVYQLLAIASEGARCHLSESCPCSLYALGRGGLSYEPDVRKEAWRGLLRAQGRLERQGITCKSRLVFAGQNAGSPVVEQARAMQAQVIVVAAKRYLLPWWLRDGGGGLCCSPCDYSSSDRSCGQISCLCSESPQADFTSN